MDKRGRPRRRPRDCPACCPGEEFSISPRCHLSGVVPQSQTRRHRRSGKDGESAASKDATRTVPRHMMIIPGQNGISRSHGSRVWHVHPFELRLVCGDLDLRLQARLRRKLCFETMPKIPPSFSAMPS